MLQFQAHTWWPIRKTRADPLRPDLRNNEQNGFDHGTLFTFLKNTQKCCWNVASALSLRGSAPQELSALLCWNGAECVRMERVGVGALWDAEGRRAPELSAVLKIFYYYYIFFFVYVKIFHTLPRTLIFDKPWVQTSKMCDGQTGSHQKGIVFLYYVTKIT